MSIADFHPRGWSIEEEVRIILCARHASDLSETACRQFAREFVQTILPRWVPGAPLTWQEAQMVGEEFNRALRAAWNMLPRWQRNRLRFVRQDEIEL